MDKKGGECTYTITGKEPVSERVMNTILNGMMREHGEVDYNFNTSIRN